VGYTNAFNFMDGINGISGMQAIISGSGVAIMAVLVDQAELHSIALAAALVAGSAVGFLPHNFPRARVFMGDVGSVPIGFVTAGLGVVFAFKAGFWLLLPLVLLHSNYILDTSITLLRRIARGEKWYLPHREHFYQRLIRSGFSHSFVTFSEGCLQLATMGGAIACLSWRRVSFSFGFRSSPGPNSASVIPSPKIRRVQPAPRILRQQRWFPNWPRMPQTDARAEHHRKWLNLSRF
jgi:UDP-N-acetylmuramyl pentapeptide phosphotransferase/UDP-N-acetylglucosamine-1-phosphate transferase